MFGSYLVGVQPLKKNEKCILLFDNALKLSARNNFYLKHYVSSIKQIYIHVSKNLYCLVKERFKIKILSQGMISSRPNYW